MKIAIITYHFLPNWLGGIEVATNYMAKELVKRGHEVHIITSYDENLPKISKENGYYIHRLTCRKVVFVGVILFWINIFFSLKKIDPELVHVQSIGNGIPAYLAKIIMKKPYLVWGHGSDVYLPWRFKWIISKIVIENAGIVVALSEDMRKRIKKKDDKNIIVLPNGIDIELFKKGAQNLNPSNDKKTILFVGTLHNVKGVIYLIDAIKIVSQTMSEVSLLIVGDGKDREELKRIVDRLNLNRYIQFVGKVPNERIPEYMARSDIFVLPSLSEGLPVVVLEAMASGLPIIATNVGGLPDIIKNGENGFLVKPKNSKEIAEKILVVLKNDELKKKMSNNNKQKANEYSWEKIVKKLEGIYQGLFVNL